MSVLPVKSKFRITSGFYRANGDYHGGIDLAVPQGSEIVTVNSGKVRLVTVDQYGGAFIDIVHGDNSMTRYLHLSKFLVRVGQSVRAGDTIALAGGQPGTWGAGLSTGPHLHFEIWDKPNGTRLDPRPFIDKWQDKRIERIVINPENKINMFEKEKNEIVKVLENPKYQNTPINDGNNYGELRGMIHTKGDLSTPLERILSGYVAEFKRRLDRDQQILDLKADIKDMEKQFESTNLTSSEKQWWQSKKFMALLVGIVGVITARLDPSLQGITDEIMIMISTYVAGQSAVDFNQN